MGQFVSRVHNKQDDKLYNILPLGDMPTVVFGRVIREHSVPGMQYYFSDGRVKYKDGNSEKRDNMSNGGGWDAVIPFTKEKKFSAVKFNGDGETWLYRRYADGDTIIGGKKPQRVYAWVYVHNSANKGLHDADVNWLDLDFDDILYTPSTEPSVDSYDTSGDYEVLEFSDSVTSSMMTPTQLPVIFTVPENLDFSRMNDVEYIKQFCRTAVNLNANTMSANFVIRNNKIICTKKVHFESNKILSTDGGRKPRTLSPKYKTRFSYKYLRANTSTRRNSARGVGKYKMYTRSKVEQCIHNEFSIIPIVKRNRGKFYKSINEYKAYRYGCHSVNGDGGFTYWKWKLK